MTVASTWNDGDAASQRDVPTLQSEFKSWDGDLDVAVGGTVLKSDESYAQAAQGAYLDRWTAMAKNIQSVRGDKNGITYVRPFHEFNGNWYKNWFVTPDNVQDYKKSFRLMAETIRQNCPRCKIVWSPNNGTSSGGAPVEEAYPGDDVVDVIGVDSYNANGATRVTDGTSWEQYAGDTDGANPVGPEAWRQFAERHGKPISFPEWGLNHGGGGGDDPGYIQGFHDWLVQHAAQPGQADIAGKVVYDCYFNIAMDSNDGFVIKDGPNPKAGALYQSLRWGNTDGAPVTQPQQDPNQQQTQQGQQGQQGQQQPSEQQGQDQKGQNEQVPAADVRVGPTGRTAAAQALKDLPYATGSGSQKLDLYLPDRTGSAVPLVIDLHGGAFSEGDKGDGEVVANVQPLLAQGYAVASVNYRLSGEAAFPAGVQDVKAAVRWLRAHAGEYGIDPNRFAAWGASAGGYMASMLGVTGGIRDAVLDDAALGNRGVSSAVQGVVSMYGPADFTAMDAQLKQAGCDPASQSHDQAGSPESVWLRAPVQTAPMKQAADLLTWAQAAPAGSLPPFLLGHGSADCTVPVGQSTELADTLKRAGTTVQLQVIDGAGHSDPKIDQGLQKAAIDFITQKLGAGTATGAGPATAAGSASVPAATVPAATATVPAATVPAGAVAGAGPAPALSTDRPTPPGGATSATTSGRQAAQESTSAAPPPVSSSGS